jgi:hypothetical protein
MDKLFSKHFSIQSSALDSLLSSKNERILEKLLGLNDTELALKGVLALATQNRLNLFDVYKRVCESITTHSPINRAVFVFKIALACSRTIPANEFARFQDVKEGLKGVLITRPDFWPVLLDQLQELLFSCKHLNAIDLRRTFECASSLIQLIFLDSSSYHPSIAYYMVYEELLRWVQEFCSEFPEFDSAALDLLLLLCEKMPLHENSIFNPSLLLEKSLSIMDVLISKNSIEGHSDSERTNRAITVAIHIILIFDQKRNSISRRAVRFLSKFSNSCDKINSRLGIQCIAQVLVIDRLDAEITYQLLSGLSTLLAKIPSEFETIVFHRLLSYPLIRLISDRRFENDAIQATAEKILSNLNYQPSKIMNIPDLRALFTELPQKSFYFLSKLTSSFKLLMVIHSSTPDWSLDQLSLWLPRNMDICVYCSLVFHPVYSVKMHALRFIGSHPSPELSHISFVLYIMKSCDPETQRAILVEIFPLFARQNDPYMIAAILRIIMSLDSHVLKLIALYHFWLEYPRCWNRLRSCMGELLQRWRISTTKDPMMELSVCSYILSYSRHERKNAADILPLIINALSFSELTVISKSMILESLGNCIQEEAINYQSGKLFVSENLVWNVTLLPFINAQKQQEPQILMSLCKIYSLIGDSSNGKVILSRLLLDSEEFQAFQLDILKNYVLPLIEFDNPSVSQAAFDCLSHFSYGFIQMIFDSPHNQIVNMTSSLLTRALSCEIEAMSKPLFKGLMRAERVDVDKRSKLKSESVNLAKQILEKGRIQSSRKSGLAVVSLLHIPIDDSNTLLSTKTYQHAVKDIQFDHHWQTFDAILHFGKNWDKHLLHRYDALENATHSEKLNILTNLVTNTVHESFKSLKTLSIPYQAANILYQVAGIRLY